MSTSSDEGVIAAVTPDGVQVELHIIATPDTNLLKLGEALQVEVRRAIEHMVGMPVSRVDVNIEGIALESQPS